MAGIFNQGSGSLPFCFISKKKKDNFQKVRFVVVAVPSFVLAYRGLGQEICKPTFSAGTWYWHTHSLLRVPPFYPEAPPLGALTLPFSSTCQPR